ncbi:AMP-binding protein [Alsobacter sp. KACC 23698]|uniref:Long-chain-fatty-acid--CoA ligase n=1 Tax=Alsobacter sp. KACC 23698 TaxID=3149229 RepID=A0AAU7JH45_9HYPH
MSASHTGLTSAAVTEAPAPDFPWQAHYPPNVPATIDVDKAGSLADMFRDSVARHAGRPALESFGKRLTYAELGAAATAVASWLQARGLRKGDRVALMMPNVAAYPASIYGVLLAGGVVVNVNPLYTARELSHQLNDSGARMLVVLENFAHTVEQALPSVTLDAVVVARPGDLLGLKGKIVDLVSRYVKKSVAPFSLPGMVAFSTLVEEGGRRPFQTVPIEPGDVAFLQYTGGTTGVAKGATLLHRNVSANVMQCEAWMRPFMSGADQVMLTALPLYHVFALTACCMFMTRIGGCQLLITNPRDIAGLVKTLRTRPFTCMVLVNTLYNALINAPGIDKVDFSRVAFSASGGMATQQAVAAAWKALTGKAIVEGYGLSETSPVACANPLNLEEFSGTIGYPLPSTEISIRGPDNEVLPAGTPGELCIKGPQVMAGYWNRPDETARVTTPDGFFRSGDIAVLQPDGQVRIVDRIKDMVLVSGFNVYPNEVEDVLVSHPGVLEAAVVGMPDAHSGEAVVAYVVRKDRSLSAEALKAYCKENLTGYKVPRRIEFASQLPKTNVGKVLRRALRDEPPPPESDAA